MSKLINSSIIHQFRRGINTPSAEMDLSTVVSQLKRLAPLNLAEKWDNVGLLVEPSPPHKVEKLLLTNDLTENVVQESIDVKANFILSYHPPIFAPVKRLTASNWKERIVVKCLENRIAVYSPHTSFDAISDGVNNWLAEAFDVTDSKPISVSYSSTSPSGFSHKIEAYMNKDVAVSPEVDKVLEKLGEIVNNPKSSQQIDVNFRSSENHPCVLTVHCKEEKLADVAAVLSSCGHLMKCTEIFKQDKLPLPGYGMGRVCNLKNSIKVRDAVTLVKRHLNLNHLRVAIGYKKNLDSSISTVAVCAGSGSSILEDAHAELYVTGEMSHHQVLDAVSKGVSVILCEHSNSERGYLATLAPQLKELFQHKVQVVVSKMDADPLVIM